MNSQKPRSLQAILKRRRQEAFVGRKEQVALFHQNLNLDLDDDRRRFVFNVFGQGGVGKTNLLHRFSRLTEDAVNAWTDEIQEDVLAVMGHIAKQFDEKGHALKKFSESYQIYHQRHEELEADPEAPQGHSAFVGHILAKADFRLSRTIPIGGSPMLDFMDEDSFASQVSEWATYVAHKLTNKDEVRLVQKPVEILTPLFLDGLQRVAEMHLVSLFFDTYERTSEYLDDWLRNLLDGYYGEVPPNIIFVIAGRDELKRDLWVPFEGLVTRLPLEPFTEQEAREYLVRKGIIDDHVIEVILHLSGRLPLLVATLADEKPDDPNKVGDPSGTAVDRFLKWEEDPKQRQVALVAALSRQLNRDVLAELVGEKDADSLFAWLKQKPFMLQRADCWVYHGVVRDQMLHYKHHESPHVWADIHNRLVFSQSSIEG